MATAIQSDRLQLPPPLLRALLGSVHEGRAPAAAANLLRESGFAAGAGFYALLADEAGDPPAVLPAPRFWKAFAELWASLGWGSIEHHQLHPAVAELSSADWAEAGAAQNGIGCQLTTGVFADVLRRVAGDEVAVFEVACRSRGDDRCRFLVGSPSTLQVVYGAILEARSVDEAVAALG